MTALVSPKPTFNPSLHYNNRLMRKSVHTHTKKNNPRQNGKNEATHFALTNADGIKAPTLCVHVRVHQCELSSVHHPPKIRNQSPKLQTRATRQQLRNEGSLSTVTSTQLPTFGKVRHSIKVSQPRETGISTKKDPNRDLVSTSTAITDTGQVSNTAMTSTRIQRWPDPTSMAGTFIPTYNLVSTILPGSQVCREPTTHQTRFKIIHWN